jgi:hypothetical protein
MVQLDWRRLPSCRPWDEALHGNIVIWGAQLHLQGGNSAKEDEERDEGQLAQYSNERCNMTFFWPFIATLFSSGLLNSRCYQHRYRSRSDYIGMHASRILPRARALQSTSPLRGTGSGLLTGAWTFPAFACAVLGDAEPLMPPTWALGWSLYGLIV